MHEGNGNGNGNGSVRASALSGSGSLLRLITDGEAMTRAELVRHTGLARSTVAQRVDALLAHALLVETSGNPSTGGRPPAKLAFNRDAGLVLVADIGATHSRLAACDLTGTPLAEVALDQDIAAGPEAVLSWVDDRFAELLDQVGRSREQVWAVGIGVPGPVAFATGQPANPPIMPGWSGFSIRSWFADRYEAPVLVDNDVNIMALGEHHTHWRDADHLLFVKVGTGIGCGIVAGRKIHRGSQGAAGDIGHVRIEGHDDVACRCGNMGCLEAVAGGQALAGRLAQAGLDARHSRDVVRLAQAGEPQAVRMVRDAGRALGDVLAAAVNFFNPGAIVLGGDIADTDEHLLAGVRETIFQRSLPLATRDLRIVRSRLGDRAGITGAAMLAIEHVLAPEAIDRAIGSSVMA
jgi:predicted NBD/HSP70 family sugar kinase